MGAPPRKRAKGELASKVDRLSSDMVRIQELLLTLQPGAGGGVADVQPDPSLEDGPNMDDALSLVASANLFNERVTEDGTSITVGETSYSSARSSGHSTECTPMGAVICTALARLGLDAPQADLAQPSAFFRGSPAPTSFSVPPSEEYLKELHSSWKDVKAPVLLPVLGPWRPCRIQRSMGWVACRPLSPPLPPSFWSPIRL